MEYNHILIRYAELALKGKNRKEFERKLMHNVQRALIQFSEAKVKRTFGRMFVELNGEEEALVTDRLKDVFGIHSFSPALKIELDQDKINDAALWAVKDALPNEKGTFKVSVKRINKNYPHRSQQLNYDIGSHILRNTDHLTVDVHHPDVEVKVEIREEATYITCKSYLGAGGLPIHTAGKVLLMLSGGIDSPVAGYLALKRGVELEAIHFHSPPFTNDRARQKVEDLTRVLTRFGGHIKLHIIPFTEAQKAIHQQIPDSYEMTVMRRFMLRIAEGVAKKKHALAIVNGESLGQVASQTLDSMHTINDVTNLPVLRPLVTMDKLEVIEIAKKIGTYELSILPFEDCCTIFLPPQSKTKPNKEKTIKFEQEMDVDFYVQDAIERMETVKISEKTNIDEEFKDLF
ncbi:tRNA uracil 4-sulfurtransferase ThiI [Evansella cellulosilytica]|uniref:Probable tRNA sulfurtransferase n=1 Tax=Evansella cellulosilytica (strain ATCC 21833 / DSM 2522 / FERM P-1141 / JCM 9156 / N-4) TaxID=649639 RepID=E6U150_EVAC2|nr:tRNA uracil 4-sulfurtransferase ThiI [Evansella cellulosilytica]ADU31496.1 thiamine biosynthesis/tRNA modification protein ThiI [Evansella cellulosilytica DSM 2522]